MNAYSTISRAADTRPFPAMAALLAHKCPAPWTTDPRALALLEQVRNDQPQLEARFAVYVQTRDEWTAYTGELADELRAIREANGDETLTFSQRTGDFAPFTWWCEVTVDAAIEAMLGCNPEVLTAMVYAAAGEAQA
jgi:hypothetical protein